MGIAQTTDESRVIRMTVGGLLDGSTRLPAQPDPPSRDAFNNINIVLAGAADDLGEFVPELEDPNPVVNPNYGTGKAWFMRSYLISMAGAGGASATFRMINTGNGQLIEEFEDLNGVTTVYADDGWWIPPEAILRIDGDGNGEGHLLQFTFWTLDATREALLSV